jgi:hypothetical protein
VAKKLSGDARMALMAAVALTVVGLAIGDVTVGTLIGAIVFPLIFFVMSRVPLRDSLLTIAFCAIVLENPDDAPSMMQFKTPLYPIGAILLTHWNTFDRGGLLGIFPISGIDVLLVAAAVIGLSRESSRSQIDRRDRSPTPRPLVRLAWLALAAIPFIWIPGLLRGGDFGKSLWQVFKVIYVPLFFLLFHLGLRGPDDVRRMGKLLFSAAMIKAIMATIIFRTVTYQPDPDGPSVPLVYATTHHDSMLFAHGFGLCMAWIFERTKPRLKKIAFFCAPIILLGVFSNGRRLAFVQLLSTVVVIYFMTPLTPFKRKLHRATLFLIPLALVYITVGWNSGSTIFKPVRALHTVVDSKADPSTMWREIENFNIISTIRQNPMFGTGYGHGFNEVVPMPEVPYELERYAPHNSILGMWCYTGYFGFLGLTLLWVGGVYFAARAYRATDDPIQRVAALGCFVTVPIYLIQCWGDLGLGTSIGTFTMAPALALAGKLAVAHGAWGSSTPKAPVQVEPPRVWAAET